MVQKHFDLCQRKAKKLQLQDLLQQYKVGVGIASVRTDTDAMVANCSVLYSCIANAASFSALPNRSTVWDRPAENMVQDDVTSDASIVFDQQPND